MKMILTLCTAMMTLTAFGNDHYDEMYRIDDAKTRIYEIKVDDVGNEELELVNRGSQKELNKIITGKASIVEPSGELPNRTLPSKPGSGALPTPNPTSSTGDVKNVIATTRELIALGKEIYQIVEAGRPVVNVQSDALSILPRDAKGEAVDSFALSGWKDPMARTYRVETKNGIQGTWFEGTPVAFDFMLLYTYGGRLDERGYYITGAQINAKNLSVGWGYDLNVVVKNSSIINIGTAENPIASGIVTIEYTIKTVLKETRNSVSFLISGIGKTKVY